MINERNERLQRFTMLLKNIFELDKSDLDFGIYRVLNLRREEIETFLNHRLPQLVAQALSPFAQDSRQELRAQMAHIEEMAASMGQEADNLPENTPMGEKYQALKRKLAQGADLTALETDVYSALYTFFSRYYEEGDFRYFLQTGECRAPVRSKVKAGKWIDTPDRKRYHDYICSWHFLLKQLETAGVGADAENAGMDRAKELNMALLQIFFMRPYETGKDFYEQYSMREKEFQGMLFPANCLRFV